MAEFGKLNRDNPAGGLPPSPRNTVYFVDFDHTISRRDVWDAIVKTCAPDVWLRVIQRYIRGEISSRECNLELAQSLRVPERQARELAESIGIDPTFHAFADWVRAQESRMLILSDGYDYYIDLLLRNEGLESIPRYCNRMVWTGDKIQVEFPLYRKECERDMAHCKCQHVLPVQGLRRVYIGDGVSDTCAASKCDFVYAKRDLLEFCLKNRMAHCPFEDFQRIIERETEWFEQARAGAREES